MERQIIVSDRAEDLDVLGLHETIAKPCQACRPGGESSVRRTFVWKTGVKRMRGVRLF